MRTLLALLAAVLVTAALVPTGPAHAEAEVKLDPRSGAKSIDSLLGRLQAAWTNINHEEYRFCLADTFRFTPHLSVARDYPNLDASGWDRRMELAFAKRIFVQASKIQIKLPSRIRDRGAPSRNAESWVLEYIIEVQQTVYAGRASLDFVRIDKRWYLAGWTDQGEIIVKGGRSPTSGVLRGKFRPKEQE